MLTMMTFASAPRATQQGLLGHIAGSGWVARIAALLRQVGPYAAIELLLPGGSLLALALWLYRRQQQRGNTAAGSEPSPCYADQEALRREGSRGASLLASPC